MVERTARALAGDEHSRLGDSWRGHREAMHVRQAGGQRRIYEQTIHAPSTMHAASISARQDFVASRSTLERNILGRGFSENWISYYVNALNLAAGDMGASIAKVNDDEERVGVPISNHRSEERRGGKGCVSRGRYRLARDL